MSGGQLRNERQERRPTSHGPGYVAHQDSIGGSQQTPLGHQAPDENRGEQGPDRTQPTRSREGAPCSPRR